MNITIAGAIVGAVVAVFLQETLRYLLPRIKSRRADLPDIVGEWRGQWYLDGGQGQTLYNTDRIDIEKQSGFKVFGRGRDEKGTYLLKGRFSISSVVCLTYEYQTRLKSLTGVVILQVDPLENTCEGWWYGYTKEKKVQGGKVIWGKIA